MHPFVTKPATGFLASPLSSWLPQPADDLTKMVTSNAGPGQKITALQRFLALTGESAQIDQWQSLLEVAAIDVAVARMLEPHIDALGILADAGLEPPDESSTWGVYAAEAPGKTVTVTGTGDSAVITGTKAWCSLASELTHAIVTANTGRDDQRQACAVDLRAPGVHPESGTWSSVGLKEIPSESVRFDHAPVEKVGPPGWYLDRPGFAWGGIRVAACWFGGALGLAQKAARRQLGRPSPSPTGEMVLGQLDVETVAVRSVLAQAAEAADGDEKYSRTHAWTLALRVRNLVYRSAQRIQRLSRELAGPAALTSDAAFAKADADLTVYLSQHHGARDEAALGHEVATEFGPQ